MYTEKLDLQSPDLVNENFEKLAALFPNCVTETAEGKAIDFDLLKQELSHAVVEGNKERYRLEWPGKREAIVTANLPTTKTLRPVREDSVDFDNTENLYIEGDNLEVLKILQESYLGKIKMIYIDPPYNTGNDFVYKDNFTQDSDEYKEDSGQKDEYNRRLVANPDTSGRYHSDWLSMMYPRLKLARNLLKDDGVIFISIDENEVHNLRKVCDEIFGLSNFLTELCIKVRHENRILKGDKDFHEVYEYCLIYKKGVEYKQAKKIEDNTSIEKYNQTIEITGKPVEILTLDGKKVEVYSPSGYSILKHEVPSEEYLQSISIRGSLKEGNSSGRFYMKHLDNIKENYAYLYKVPDMGGDKFDYRFFMRPISDNHANGTYFQGVPLNRKDTKEVPYPNFYDFVKIFNNVGYEGEVEFRNGKKPLKFIHRLFKLAGLERCPNAIVLDFFSGSSTTAHAIMQLNSKDEGKRNYIMVQIPETTDEKSKAFQEGLKNICEIGKERIRRAGKKILEERQAILTAKKQELEKLTKDELALPGDEKVESLQEEIASLESSLNNLDTGFRVYRLDESNMQDVYYRPQDYKQTNLDLFADNVKPDRTPDDLLAQIMLDWGLPLSLKIEQLTIEGKQVYRVAENSLYACFDRGIDEAFAKAVAKDQPLRVVFRDNGFKDDTAKTNVKQLLKQLSPETEMKVI